MSKRTKETFYENQLENMTHQKIRAPTEEIDSELYTIRIKVSNPTYNRERSLAAVEG